MLSVAAHVVESESSHILHDEGVVARSVEDIHAPMDPRVSVSSGQNDVTLAGTKSPSLKESSEDLSEKEKGDSPIYIDFEEGDKRNPANFSFKKKCTITGMAILFTIVSASAASAYNLGFDQMIKDLNCTTFQATLGLSLYALGFGVTPLVTASFSEEFGRQPLYIVSAIGFLLMYLAIAMAKNIQTVLICRFLQGAFGSTGATMVGGTIADIWPPSQRGLPMSAFAVAAIGGTGYGPLMGGFVEMNPHLGWRWIQWIQTIYFGAYTVLVPFLMAETRSAVLLTRIAKKLRKETGDQRYRARVEDERTSLRTLIYISCTRAPYLMTTEPVVASFSLWIGFLWGVCYCLIESIGGAFKSLHGFNNGQVGLAFLTLVVGSLLGFASNNFIQEYLYKRDHPRRGPEARLHSACAAAAMIPIGMLIYAWTSYTHVHWIAMMIGITIFIWGTFIVYLAVFSYLADCYGPFASSALAGQSLARNLMGFAFPLFTIQMYDKLGYRWANTLFSLIGAVMMPIPFVLFFYGPKIRSKSKFSRAVMESQGQKTP